MPIPKNKPPPAPQTPEPLHTLREKGVTVHSLISEHVPTAPVLRASPKALAGLAARGYSEAEIFSLVVPKRTLARRQAADEPLTIEETDKALRLERIAALAEKVFGDPAKAHRWMRKPKRALNGETPLAFLSSESGARIVEEMLFRIQHGMFA